MTELVKQIQQEEEAVRNRLQKAKEEAEAILQNARLQARTVLAQAEEMAEETRQKTMAQAEAQAESEDARSSEETKVLCRTLRENSDAHMEKALAFILREICGIG